MPLGMSSFKLISGYYNVCLVCLFLCGLSATNFLLVFSKVSFCFFWMFLYLCCMFHHTSFVQKNVYKSKKDVCLSFLYSGDIKNNDNTRNVFVMVE